MSFMSLNESHTRQRHIMQHATALKITPIALNALPSCSFPLDSASDPNTGQEEAAYNGHTRIVRHPPPVLPSPSSKVEPSLVAEAHIRASEQGEVDKQCTTDDNLPQSNVRGHSRYDGEYQSQIAIQGRQLVEEERVVWIRDRPSGGDEAVHHEVWVEDEAERGADEGERVHPREPASIEAMNSRLCHFESMSVVDSRR